MDQELSKSERASKSHQCFKSYGLFTEGVKFLVRFKIYKMRKTVFKASRVHFFWSKISVMSKIQETREVAKKIEIWLFVGNLKTQNQEKYKFFSN